MIGYTRVTVNPETRTATAEVIRVADVSSDLKTLTTVYPAGTVFESVVMSLPELPVAAFSSDTQSGTAPLTVQFTDTSTGTPTSWAWDFTNDGTVDSTEQNPSHIYDTDGIHTVKLTATGQGWTDDATMHITVGAIATPEFPSPALPIMLIGAVGMFAVILKRRN